MSHESPNQPPQNQEEIDARIRRWAGNLVRPELVDETAKNIKKEVKEKSKKLVPKDVTGWFDDNENVEKLSKEEKDEIRKKIED